MAVDHRAESTDSDLEFDEPDQDSPSLVIDPLLLIQYPAVCKPIARLVGDLNRARREQVFEASTQRKLSQLEHVEVHLNRTSPDKTEKRRR